MMRLMVDDALTRFCAELPELRSMLRGSPASRALLDRIEAAAREGEAVAPLLRQLGIDVADGNQPPGRDAAVTATPLRTLPHAVTGVYLCPRRLCLRAQVRGATEALPVCHLHGEALRFVSDGL